MNVRHATTVSLPHGGQSVNENAVCVALSQSLAQPSDTLLGCPV